MEGSTDESRRTAHSLKYKGGYSNIGLDLGSSQVKFLQFKRDRSRIQVHQYGIYGLPEEVIEGGRVTDAKLLASRLKWMLGRRRLHKKRVNLCIGGQSVILRQVFLPPMSSKELVSAIRWEAEKQVMVPLNQMVVDYASLGVREVDGKQVNEVVLVAVPGEVVEEYIAAVTGAGFYPEVIEIEPFALQRSVYYLQRFVLQTELPDVIVLDVGGETSTLLVLEEGRYSFSRTINIGVQHFNRRVMESAQVNADEAQRLTFGKDSFSIPGVLEVADELCTQIKRSMEYFAYEMRHREKEFGEMFYCGGGSNIKDLWPFLGRELKIIPVPFNPLATIPGSRRSPHHALQEEGSLLAVAQGLALRGWVT